MRALGVRFGAYHIYVPALLKPAPSALLAVFWALKNGGLDIAGLAELPRLAASGRTSVPVDPAIPRALYRVVGYRLAGNRAVRIDILERLADLIRPLIAWRPTPEVADAAGRRHRRLRLHRHRRHDVAARLFRRGFRLGAALARLPRRPSPAPRQSRRRRPERRRAGEAVPARQPPATRHQRTASSEAGIVGTAAEAVAEAIAPATDAETDRPKPRRRPTNRPCGSARPLEPPRSGTLPRARRLELPRRTGLHRGLAARPRGRPDRPSPPRTPSATMAPADAAASAPAPAGAAPRPRPTARPPRQENRRKGKPGKPRPRTHARPRRSASAHRPAAARRNGGKPVDPDSPFAALAALKARLEGREND